MVKNTYSNNINIAADDQKATGVWNEEGNTPRFATLGDVFLSKETKLNDVKERYASVMNILLSKVSNDPDLSKQIAERLKKIINGIELGPNGQKFSLTGAKAIAASNRLMDIFKEQVANLASEFGLYNTDDSQSKAFGPPWSAQQWSNLLQALKSRAATQADNLEKKVYEELDESKKKVLEFRRAIKVSYVRQIENLQQQLADIKNKYGISGTSPIPDSLLSQYAKETNIGNGKNRNGGGYGTGSGGSGSTDNEGAAQQANNKKLQTTPFTSMANGDLPIKKLLMAYGLDNNPLFDYVMTTAAPDVLVAKDWLSLTYQGNVSKHLIDLQAAGVEPGDYMAKLYYALAAINKKYKEAVGTGNADTNQMNIAAKWLHAVDIYRTNKYGVGRGARAIDEQAKERQKLENGGYGTKNEQQPQQQVQPQQQTPKDVWRANYSSNVAYYDKVMEDRGFKKVNDTWYVNSKKPQFAVQVTDGSIFQRNDQNQWFDTGKNMLPILSSI